MSAETDHLDDLFRLVHPLVRALRVGDANLIPCSRKFPPEEVREYLFAYAAHKKTKWFSAKFDPVSNMLHVVRVPKPKVTPLQDKDDGREVQ